MSLFKLLQKHRRSYSQQNMISEYFCSLNKPGINNKMEQFHLSLYRTSYSLNRPPFLTEKDTKG